MKSEGWNALDLLTLWRFRPDILGLQQWFCVKHGLQTTHRKSWIGAGISCPCHRHVGQQENRLAQSLLQYLLLWVNKEKIAQTVREITAKSLPLTLPWVLLLIWHHSGCWSFKTTAFKQTDFLKKSLGIKYTFNGKRVSTPKHHTCFL